MDIQSLRTQIPALAHGVYLNTGTFGPNPRAATQEIVRAYELIGEHGGFSPVVRQQIERAGFETVRSQVARFVNAAPDEIALTRSATDGICTVAYGLDWRPGDEVVVTDQEHPSGELPWINLHHRFGVDVRVVRVAKDPGVTLQRFAGAISAHTRLVFASQVCSTNGEILPVREICELARARRTLAAIDGAHALGQVRVDARELQPDFYIMCGHKWLLGPQGTGMLYVAREQIERLAISWTGWGAQEDYSEDLETRSFELRHSARRFEFATKPWALFLGLGKAIEFIEGVGLNEIKERVRALTARFTEEIANVPGIELLTPPDESRRAGLVSVSVPGFRGDLRQAFWERGRVLVSSHEPKRRVRFSIAFFTTENEMEIALDALRAVAQA